MEKYEMCEHQTSKRQLLLFYFNRKEQASLKFENVLEI